MKIKNKILVCVFSLFIGVGIGGFINKSTVAYPIYPGTKFVKCPQCSGTGKCWYCDGKGTKVKREGIYVGCDACNETGRCKLCSGKGVVREAL